MTLIEFFDKGTAIENIYACLSELPLRVVLIGSKRSQLEKSAQRYKSVLSARGHNVDFICRSVSRNNLEDITELLSNIVESCDNCIFDLTGGEELYLVAAGIVFEKYRKIKPMLMRRYNIITGSIYDYGKGYSITKSVYPKISIAENITIYGGAVSFGDTATYKWDMNDDFRRDILKIWDICRRDTKHWNTQVSLLSAHIGEGLGGYNAKLPDRDFLDDLLSAGVLKYYKYTGEFKVGFKNSQIKKVFYKAGQALEFFVLLACLELRDDKGEGYFNDALCGVVADWDGEVGTGREEVENEIDVMAMRGGIPVFISCKNGFVEIDELYKLSAVAEKFGGRYAGKILVASRLDTETQFGKYFIERANDMNIRVISNMTDLSLSELSQRLKI